MIYLGSDHGGFALKTQLILWLLAHGHTNQEIEDLGAHTLDPQDDYPVYGKAVAAKVAEDPAQHRGVLLCRSGGGMAIVANRHREIRAVDCHSVTEAKYAREANNANVLSLPADVLSAEEAQHIIEVFLSTAFSGEERHLRRIQMIDT